MTYRFKLQEPIGEAVSRIGLEQIDMATAKLASKDDVPAAIHDARRCLKRLRALLRLIRPGLADGAYRREAKLLAGTGRLLSVARDLFVTRQTLDKLEDRFGPLPNGGTAERLGKLIAAGHARNRRASADGRRQALQRLERARRLFAGKAVERIEFDHLTVGLAAAYRKARKAFRHAYREPSDEAFHALRKRVQLHWRHMSLLSHGWPEAMSARAAEAKELSRLLGEDHDCAVLLAFVSAPDMPPLEADDLDVLTQRCRAYQADLRAQARPRGERLFAERPSALEKRVRLYWTSALRLATLAPADSQPATSGGMRQARRGKVRSRRAAKASPSADAT
jgi:CHAD domain-containing protein